MHDYDAVVHRLREMHQTRSVDVLPELLEDLEYYADAAIHSGRIVEARRWRVVARAADLLLHGDFDDAIATLNETN